MGFIGFIYGGLISKPYLTPSKMPLYIDRRKVRRERLFFATQAVHSAKCLYSPVLTRFGRDRKYNERQDKQRNSIDIQLHQGTLMFNSLQCLSEAVAKLEISWAML